jgi:proteasome lid subunit RPN8/RPN11
VTARFSLRLEVFEDGELVESVPANIAACVEHALFDGVRHGRLDNDGTLPEFDLQPHFGASGPPAVCGLELASEGATTRYDREVFEPQARTVLKGLFESKRLSDARRVQWQVSAHGAAQAAQGPPACSSGGGARRRSAASVTRAPYPFIQESLAELAPGSLEVTVDERLLGRLRDAVVRVGRVEQAGLLAGRILHDPDRSAIRIAISDEVPLIPVTGGASESHFTFDPADMVAARRRVLERGDGQVPVGWHHSHPTCAECPARPECTGDTVFFSSADVDVHARLMPSAQLVALVAGKVRHLPATRPGFRLYGWQQGRVGRRAFRITGPGSAAWSSELGPCLHEEE